MGVLHRLRWAVASAGVVPLLTLASPSFLKVAGVSPSWAVLWLLPWSLADGPLSGALAGVGLGLLVDSLQVGPETQIPALALLGWWWGRLARKGAPIERSLSLGLLALLGTLFLGLSLLLQRHGISLSEPLLRQAGLHTLLAQTLVTALLAPMICSLLLLLWRRQGAI
ncbi:rod shape-determining protein MreD [Synechococcus sp. CS-602]|uniref:rod shape-determining protein MreD n=1 Tax=Synechococcaceae TaxID=1890426 RepID=UPI0008FF2703|nr:MULTISPECIES: rod shape-determining protein MreD [Synechococcaceae]MCT4364473.1 rod shape-determining protein MreD [Candidatus Regnicoccus frigidus MAG-AL1]APD48053.1 rod shape-determining protein MreD [Synechococcus sp. SynAce01]MCT0203059.1 rod shape-determining protein MreD [Synechococcus sp. CS-603]MCT0204695.1 rod shape-determining protein MreD [Synechococcus sp. CS-602]MCT0246117.1 rod shape-determining protein MreD [Synechococcus sp. CS-601]